MSYREAMCDLSEMAKDGPAYVRVKALVTIVRETSPNNARHGDVMRELGLADELPEASGGAQGCVKCGHGNEAREAMIAFREGLKRAEEEEGGEDAEDPH
ncbi:MAG: hypothetical protein OXT70_02590 [Chloroflexota bacterium]|nr:hypothetical protein [Chloroflexota bacterium]